VDQSELAKAGDILVMFVPVPLSASDEVIFQLPIQCIGVSIEMTPTRGQEEVYCSISDIEIVQFYFAFF
jgi:hypothetical protein